MSPDPLSASQLAQELLELGAVVLRPHDPFTWASGIRSPIYCDNRITMSSPTVRKKLTDGFEDVVIRLQTAPDVVAGTATAGIPHAAWLANRLNLPMTYVRSTPKGHGKENMIEGRLTGGSTVVLVEDTISTGGSSLAAVQALREAGADVHDVLAIFTYGFGSASDAFTAANIGLHTLTDYDTLVQVAADMNRLGENDMETLKRWRAAPEEWGRA